MKKPQNFLKVISLALVLCSSIVVSTAEPVSAFGRMRKEYLGRATIRDNVHYWMSTKEKSRRRKISPPGNRDLICMWKYTHIKGKVYGKADGPWNTKCYDRYWSGISR